MDYLGFRGVMENLLYDDASLMQFVIPGLTRNPVPFWIPAFAGMTHVVLINDTVCSFIRIAVMHFED